MSKTWSTGAKESASIKRDHRHHRYAAHVLFAGRDEVPSDRVIDGRNILPYMQGRQFDPPIHETFMVPGATIRHRDWKLLIKGQRPGNGKSDQFGKTDRVPAKPGSLFNLKEDPGETTDVSAKHPEKVRELTEMMNAFIAELETRPIGWDTRYEVSAGDTASGPTAKSCTT